MSEQTGGPDAATLAREVIATKLAGAIQSIHKVDAATAAALADQWSDGYAIATAEGGRLTIVARNGLDVPADLAQRFSKPGFIHLDKKPGPTVADRLIEWERGRQRATAFGAGILS